MDHAKGRRPLDLCVLGAGISGLVFSYYFTQYAKKGAYRLRIFEKSNDLGGWLKNQKYVLEKYGQVYEFQTGARSATVSTGNTLPLLNIVTRLNMKNKVLISGTFSPHLGIRRIYYDGNLVKIPSFSDFSMFNPPKPFGVSLPFQFLRGMAIISRYPDFEFTSLANFHGATIDDVLRKSFGDMTADYLFNPMVHGITASSPKLISASVFLSEFSEKLFHNKLLPNYDIPQFTYMMSLFEGFKSTEEKQNYAQIFDKVYWNDLNRAGCRIWGYEGGFCELLKDIEKDLILNGVEVYYGKSIDGILPQHLLLNRRNNILLNKSRSKSLQQFYPAIAEESDGAIDLYVGDGTLKKCDVVVSSLSLKNLVGMLPINKVENILKDVMYVSIVQISFVHYTKNLKRNYDGFGFLMPESQFSQLPILGCIYNNNTFSHSYRESMPELCSEYSPVRSFTILANRDIMMKEGYDPENEDDCLKLCMKIGLLFGTKEQPLLIHKVFLNDSIPIYNVNYPQVKSVAECVINDNFPGTYLIGSINSVYSINSLTRIAAETAYEVAKKYDLLDDSIINSYCIDSPQ